MIWFFPKTLKWRAVVVLCLIFIASHLLTLVIYESNRNQTVLLTEAQDLADRIAGIVTLAMEFPPQERRRILGSARTQSLRMYPENENFNGVSCSAGTFQATMRSALNDYFATEPGISADVCVGDLSGIATSDLGEAGGGLDMLIAIDFADGESSVFHFTLPEAPSLLRDTAIIYIVLIPILGIVAAWYFILKLISPIEQLADAADAVGRDIDAPALSQEGAVEVKRAATAFNKMQKRLQRLVYGQAEMITAVSHDLRTAVTRLQLRAELLENDEERSGMLRIVEDMREMVQSVLDLLQGIDAAEKMRSVNVAALLESLCEEFAGEGHGISFHTDRYDEKILCRPLLLRRSIINIIDNALKYAGDAEVSLMGDDHSITIRVDDHGPGVHERAIGKLVTPFFREEGARNRETGGIGLGLSIANSIVNGHGGTLGISNHPSGGLRVDIHLPK